MQKSVRMDREGRLSATSPVAMPAHHTGAMELCSPQLIEHAEGRRVLRISSKSLRGPQSTLCPCRQGQMRRAEGAGGVVSLGSGGVGAEAAP